MASIESNQFRIYSAQKFLEGILETQLSSNNLFMWIGKSTPWSDETSPLSPNDNVQSRIDSFFDMLAVKRISRSDCNMVIPRVDWQSGAIYSAYTHEGYQGDGIFYDAYEPLTSVFPFYVYTEEGNVYKCLGNNYQNTSSVSPTGKSHNPFTTSDNYIWKFMFSLSDNDKLKFLTDKWIPVNTVKFNNGSDQYTVQQTAIVGSIDKINVTLSGSGYFSPVVTVTGDGNGCTASASVLNGSIVAINIVNRGINYTNATVSISDSVGSGATAAAIISPVGGHGSDALNELGAMYVMVSAEMQYSESNKISTNIKFRKYGVILNPFSYGSNFKLFSSLVGTATTNLILSSETGIFNANDVITGNLSGANAKIVDYDYVTHLLRLTEINGHFSITDIITSSNTQQATAANIVNIISPDIQLGSGIFLSLEYFTPVQRASTQIEGIKIVFSF